MCGLKSRGGALGGAIDGNPKPGGKRLKLTDLDIYADIGGRHARR